MTPQFKTEIIPDMSSPECHPPLVVKFGTKVVLIPRDTHDDKEAFQIQKLIAAAPELKAMLMVAWTRNSAHNQMSFEELNQAFDAVAKTS